LGSFTSDGECILITYFWYDTAVPHLRQLAGLQSWYELGFHGSERFNEDIVDRCLLVVMWYHSYFERPGLSPGENAHNWVESW
jgi:hypothetical protein